MEVLMEYMIIVGRDLTYLQTNVNEICRDKRWVPHGSIFLDPRTNLYCQPAVREIEDGTKEN